MTRLFRSNIEKEYTVHFLMNLHFFSGVLVPFFTDWGKISFFQITLLQTWCIVCSFLLEIPTGVIADFVSRKSSIILACLISTIGVLIYTYNPSITYFMLGELFLALSAALYSGAREALIYDSLKANGQENLVKKVFSKSKTYQMAGMLISAPIGSIIAAYLGLRWTMMLIAIPSSLALLISLTFIEPKVTEENKHTSYLEIMKSGFKYFRNHKILQTLVCDEIMVSTMCFFLIWSYQQLLKQMNVNLIYFGIIHAMFCEVEILVMNNFERLEKLFGSKCRYLTFSAIISGLAFIFLGVNTYLIPAIIGIYIISGFGITRSVLISSYTQKHIESHNRATVISLIAMLRKIMIAICYPIVGLLVEWSLSYLFVILGCIIIAFSLCTKTKEEYLID